MLNHFLTEKADRLSVFGQPQRVLQSKTRSLKAELLSHFSAVCVGCYESAVFYKGGSDEGTMVLGA